MGRTTKDKRDIFYRKAKEQGWRARSAFKLLQINDEFHIFDGVKRVVDLCAAPGSWSQVLSSRLASETSKIVAVDLQPMAPIPNVIQIQADITKSSTADAIRSHFEGNTADLVVCDGAPDVTGLHEIDIHIQGELLLAALYITTSILKKGGTFVAKIFRAKGNHLLTNQMYMLFRRVSIAKPASSRNSSLEAFVICRDYNPPDDFTASLLEPYLNINNRDFDNLTGINRKLIPFVVCGDMSGYDSDVTYPLQIDGEPDYEYREPVQPPIAPPYHDSKENKEFDKMRLSLELRDDLEFDESDSDTNSEDDNWGSFFKRVQQENSICPQPLYPKCTCLKGKESSSVCSSSDETVT